MKIWRDITQPPSSDYLWYRLNKEKEFVGYFSYKGSKWVFVTRKELKSLKIEESSKKIINSIVDGAPEAYDTLKEIADKLENIDYQDGQKVYHVATSNIQNPQEGDITVIPDTVEFTYTDIGNPMNGVDFLPKTYDKLWLTVTSDYNGNSVLDNTGRVNFYFDGTRSVIVAYAEVDSNNNVVLYLPDGTPIPNNELLVEDVEIVDATEVNSQGQTGLGQYITAKLIDKGGVKEYINGEWIDRASGGNGGTDPNAVHFNTAQTLTDAQKEQARTNIGAQENRVLASSLTTRPVTYSGQKTFAEAAEYFGVTEDELRNLLETTKYSEIVFGGKETYNILAARSSSYGDAAVYFIDAGSNRIYCIYSFSTGVPGSAIYVQYENLSQNENTFNRVTSFSSSPSDIKYPSEKLVKDSLDAKYTKPSGGIPASDLADGIIPTQTELTTSIIDTLWEAAS